MSTYNLLKQLKKMTVVFVDQPLAQPVDLLITLSHAMEFPSFALIKHTFKWSGFNLQYQATVITGPLPNPAQTYRSPASAHIDDENSFRKVQKYRLVR